MVLNQTVWSRYAAKWPPDIAHWLADAMTDIATGDPGIALMPEATGVPASRMDDAGLSRGPVLNLLVRDGLLWLPAGQRKKLVDVEGVAHVCFNRRFLAEVLQS
jgi:hypothetical protein